MTTLDEQIKAMEAELEEVLAKEKAEQEQPVEEAAEEPVEQEAEEQPEEELDEEAPEETPAAGKKWGKLRHELKEERKRREELQAKLDEMSQRVAKTEGFMLAKTPELVQERPEPEPDKVLEPTEWVEWKVRQIEKEKEQMKKQLEAITHQTTYQAEMRGVEILETRYRAERPDYDKAMEALKNQELRMAKLNGMSDQQAEAHVEATKMQIFRKLVEQGKNPAEEIYKASIELGYYKPQAEEKRSGPDLEAIKRNKAKSGSLIGAGRAGDHKISPQQVASMNPWQLLKDPSLADKALAELAKNSQ